MQALSLAAGRVAARTAGAGPTIVLLHSLLADAASCVPLAHRLAPRMRPVVLDLPGFGGSAPVAGDLAAIADRVADAIADLDCPHPPILFGNGYGSFIALLIAINRPGLVSRLVLAGTGAAFSPPGRAAFAAMANAAAARGLAAVADTAMTRLFAPDFQEANPTLIAERRTAFLATDPAVFAQACAALEQLDLTTEATTLRLPVLIVTGAQDAATPPAMASNLAARIPGAQFTLLDACAHVPQLQDPARFLAAIESFIAPATVA
jgi:3-oxoadipate enol-lactonase